MLTLTRVASNLMMLVVTVSLCAVYAATRRG